MSDLRIGGSQAFGPASSKTPDTRTSSTPTFSRSTNTATPNQQTYEPGLPRHVRNEVRSESSRAKDPASQAVDGVSFKKAGWWVGAGLVGPPAYVAGAMIAHLSARKAGYGEDVQAVVTPGGAMPAAALGAWVGGGLGENIGEWLDYRFRTGGYAPIPSELHTTERRPHNV